MKLAEYRKGFTVAVGALANVVALGLIHGTAESWAIVIISAATAAGVVVVPNAKPKA
jgi:hypothetical protein